MAEEANYDQQQRTTIHRLPQRASYDKPLIHSILDEGFVCHVSYLSDEGIPVTVPTGYARDGDSLVFHGHASGGFMKHFARGDTLCVSVTLLDGLVMARSLFHSSMNYRAVVAFGPGRVVDDPTEKQRLFTVFADHVFPERGTGARAANDAEIKGTAVVVFPLVDVSCKQRTGPPGDDEEDILNPQYYSGVIPLRTVSLPPNHDPTLLPNVTIPPYALRFSRPGIAPLDQGWQTTESTFLPSAPSAKEASKLLPVVLISLVAGFAAGALLAPRFLRA
eukprot:m.237830 g.237830  ORF g.237830 m.237830 type:complete len:277 (-) comp21426_c0_seq1:28-858(-)